MIHLFNKEGNKLVVEILGSSRLLVLLFAGLDLVIVVEF